MDYNNIIKPLLIHYYYYPSTVGPFLVELLSFFAFFRCPPCDARSPGSCSPVRLVVPTVTIVIYDLITIGQ